MMSSEQKRQNVIVVSPPAKSIRITISRVNNALLMILYAKAIILHIVCLAVMVLKHNELTDKFSDDPFYHYHSIEDSCMLFVDYNGIDHRQDNYVTVDIKWVNNKCHLVIYGSAALAGCALLMIAFLLIRTLLFKKVNCLIILDGIEVLVTGLFTGVLAVIITLGKNETCKSLEEFSNDLHYYESCEDFYFRSSQPSNTNQRRAQVYNALRTAQVTSWLAVGVIGLIGIITLIRVLLWLCGISHRRRARAALDIPLVEHDQLGGESIQNVLTYDEDDKPPPYSVD